MINERWAEPQDLGCKKEVPNTRGSNDNTYFTLHIICMLIIKLG